MLHFPCIKYMRHKIQTGPLAWIVRSIKGRQNLTSHFMKKTTEVADRYRLQGEIGSGSYSEVYLGVDEHSGLHFFLQTQLTSLFYRLGVRVSQAMARYVSKSLELSLAGDNVAVKVDLDSGLWFWRFIITFTPPKKNNMESEKRRFPFQIQVAYLFSGECI